MANGVLTEEGVSYVDRLIDLYADAGSREEYRRVEDYFDFEIFGQNNWPPAGRLPAIHEDYGRLVKDDENYVLKLRRFDDSSHPAEISSDGSYSNQNFVEAYVWLEERDSEESNFAPVGAFDAENGNWLVMEEVDQQLPVHSSHLDWVKEYMRGQGWDPHDLEIGLSGDKWKIYDYGRFEPLDEWNLTEEDVLNSDIAVNRP